ncbi:MAG: hypothetical protein CENE_03618 [Candidatus Celerinatantimonas neptuna]|nr:MAG: hypothetical protein CENE_03618 [Candidatus Celerinatantimonas neptuna]
MTVQTKNGQDIAIIGLAGRYPGADDFKSFWKNLIDGQETISTFTEDELRASGIDEELIASPNYIPRRGILGNALHFDAQFFGFTPRDAELMDPQHRIFLECCWHAFEDAGYVPGSYPGLVGVFGGTGTNWHLTEVQNHPDVSQYASGTSIVTNNDKDYVTTRVSYKLNLKGPSVNVQTACSTSMVAIVMGMRSLQCGESDLVIAGGSSIDTPERRGYEYMQGGMDSADGHCYAFDSRANGTVFSRGAGAVILKRLDDALRDGDHIYSVIKGGAINNDGDMRAGFTAPSIEGQIAVAKRAISDSGVDARDIHFVEAHGTATPLGDPIEFTSLTQAFNEFTDEKQFCLLGSVKTNIGHTDIASGMASLIKTSMALKEHRLPASLNFSSPNPNIDFENSPFRMNTECTELNGQGKPLHGLVNSFGVGGTNVCIIVEEPPAIEPSEETEGPWFFPLSAKSSDALEETRKHLLDYLEHSEDVNLADVAYTLQVGREQFNFNSCVIASDRDELLKKLSVRQIVKPSANQPTLVFMFPGQGNQYINMGKPLYESYPVFQQYVDQCCEILKPVLGRDLREIIFQGEESSELDRINETQFTQPALFVVEYALAKLWLDWGIEPSVMIGHSVGEYVAACISGVFSLEDALKAVALRGKLVQELPEGDMLAVLLTEEEIQDYLRDSKVEIAAVNYPELCVVAGEQSEVEALQDKLEDEGIFCKHLDTSHAFHSYMMEPALVAYRNVVDSIELSEPEIPFVSTLTGDWITDEQAMDKEYWVQHVRKPVLFSHAVKTLLEEEDDAVFLEVGPGRSLESAVKQHVQGTQQSKIQSSVPIAKEQENGVEHILNAFAQLWVNGVSVPWERAYKEQRRLRLSLPGYPFQRKEFKLSEPKASKTASANDDLHLKALRRKKPDIGDWFYLPSWKKTTKTQYLKTTHTTNASCWMLFADDHQEIDQSLKTKLINRGEPVIWVNRGDEYQADFDNFTFTINPDKREHYVSLFEAIKGYELTISHLVHLWNLTQVAGDESGLNVHEYKALQQAPFYQPLYLEQALVNANLMDDLHVVFACNNTFSVAGERVYCPEKALLIGPSKVFYQEYPETQVHLVDVDLLVDESPEEIADHLIGEAMIATHGNTIVYRQGQRWEEDYQDVYLPAMKEIQPEAIKNDGIYLVTGGLGGLGVVITDYLSQISDATLILTYRSPLPEREQWQSWLCTHSVDDPISEKIACILRLESRGNSVHLAQLDACDIDGMTQLLTSYDHIDGVFHAAGIAGGGIIPLKQDEECAAVVDPKVGGLLLIDELLAEKQPDFMMLFSSIAVVEGDEARIDYCAGNAFMDAFAHYRNQRRKGRTISLNFGAWGDVGMAARWLKELDENKVGDVFVEQSSDFLTLVNRQGSEEEYRVNLNAIDDWVIDDHRLSGMPSFVGATMHGILYELIHDFKSDEPLHVKNFMLTSPIIYQNGWARNLTLFVKRDGSSYKFRLCSRGVLELDWQEHVQGVLGHGQVKEFDSSSLAEIQSRCSRSESIRTIDCIRTSDDIDESDFLSVSQRWNTNVAEWVGDGEWLMEKQLQDRYLSDLERYKFHPAMIDSVTVNCVSQLTHDDFLPFTYGQVCFYSPIEAHNFAYVKLRHPFNSDDGTISVDIVFYSASGDVAMTIENYTLIKSVQRSDDAESSEQTESHPLLGDVAINLADRDIMYAEGMNAIHRVLGHLDFDQLVVVTNDLHQRLIDNVPQQEVLEVEDNDTEEVTSDGYSRPELSVEYVEPSNEIEREIIKIWQSVLGINGIGIKDSFTELGGNSLLAVQMISAVSDLFETDIRVDRFYQDQTVASLGDLVVSSLESLLEEE